MGQETERRRPGETGLPEAVIEDLLAVPRRRALLCHLATADGPVALTDLATALHERDSDAAGDEQDATRHALRDELFQVDLPKLTATGVVDYDSMRGTVTLREERVAERVT